MTLYQQLGIEQTATSEEIKRAYYRKVRQFTPEKDPDVFMSIRKAYEELSDQSARAAYDASLSRFDDISGEVTAIIIEAERLTEKGLDADAVSLLEKELRDRNKDIAASNAVQHALSKIYLSIGKSGKAVTIAEKLAKENPENINYLRLAAEACLARGWTNKANSYWSDLERLDPGNETNTLASADRMIMHPLIYGIEVEKAEQNGKKAPLICAIILKDCLVPSYRNDMITQYIQIGLVGVTGHDNLAWDDPLFTANKLAEHSQGLPGEKREEMRSHLEEGILRSMYWYFRFDILPQIDDTIRNIGAEDIFQTSLYELVSIGHTTLKAVQSGIPKMLAAFSMMRAYSQSDYCSENDKFDYQTEAMSFELDILIGYRQIKKDINRFRDEFATLYRYSADFLEAISHYNESRIYDEANRRISKLKRIDTRLDMDWLGEDDDFGPSGGFSYGEPLQRNEPIRVTKVGRNEPCPCGSGLKYKKCCGR